MPAPLPLALLGAQLMLVAADGPPNFNIEPTCKNAGVSSISDAGSDGCLRSEREAKGTLEREWPRFGAAARSQCTQQSNAGGLPSYVEMLTCLELASGTVPTSAPRNAATEGQGAPTTTGSTSDRGTGEGTSLTREPSPAQRTEPLRMLGKPAQ